MISMDIKSNTTDSDENTSDIHISERDSSDEGDELKLLEKRMLQDYSYPSPTDESFQKKIYMKKNFYIDKIQEKPEINNYEEVKQYRDHICGKNKVKLAEHQNLLANFINPETPYTGLLIYHGTGTGKTAATVKIAEGFKPIVEKYGTKIHVLVHGPLGKQSFIRELLKFTGDTYYKSLYDPTKILSEADMIKLRKQAIINMNKYYYIMSYNSFYKKVLGEKIKDKTGVPEKSRKKTEDTEYNRNYSADRIYHLDNTLLIIDEAHNLTDNGRGKAVIKIREKSKNLKIVLLTATPMINFADEIVEIINYLRPMDFPMERNKIFDNQKGYLMDFKASGKDYLRKMVRGYVSYLRGNEPYVFAERVDMGEIPPGLDFTKVIRCQMLPFQLETYENVIENEQDSLDRKSEAVSNFVFPGFSKKKNDKKLIGYRGIDGMKDIRNQLKHRGEELNKEIALQILSEFKIEDYHNLMYLTDNDKLITGDIYEEKYLKFFSIKFYQALKNINANIYGDKGAGLIFVFCNLVKAGIKIFQEILKQNGYLEFNENISSYSIKNTTRCYYCHHPYEHHQKLEDVPDHEYYPATYITLTGKSDESNEEISEQLPEEKYHILNNYFNNSENKYGKYIKIVIGSSVMNEGITLNNIKQIHILDVHFNLGKVDQAIGRGIRICRQYDIMTIDNPFPKVEIYKYVVSLKEGLTSEEKLYQKAEKKYKTIKIAERILQEEAIDCPLNRHGNLFKKELEKYKNCGTPENPCPDFCGYMPCFYKCGDKFLNAEYYDPKREVYKKISREKLDYTTYDLSMARTEIEYSKNKIKEMFQIGHVFTLRDILKYIKRTYPEEKKELFDDFYIYQALDELIPVTENDFNNFHDMIRDKYNRVGYLIYRNDYYIFQPFDENENLPLYYRQNYTVELHNKISVRDYILHTKKYKNEEREKPESETSDGISEKREEGEKDAYDFDSTQEYYENREEFDYVGVIDKKNKHHGEKQDEFKIRLKRPKFLVKKRETGVPSFKGSVCETSKNKKFLLNIAKVLNIENIEGIRKNICRAIEEKLFDLEKYSRREDHNKKTYLIIPANHPKIPFPLNLEDRVEKIIEDIKSEVNVEIHPTIRSKKIEGRFPDIKYHYYEIELDGNIDKKIVEPYQATKKGKKWYIEVK